MKSNSSIQKILGMRKPVVAYCVKCKLYYNKTNKKDIHFHDKIHRRSLIPKCEKISTGFYQNKNRFYYGIDEIRAECKIKQVGKMVFVEEVFFDSEDSRNNIMKLLMVLYPSIRVCGNKQC